MRLQHRVLGRTVGLSVLSLTLLLPFLRESPAPAQGYDPGHEKWQLGYIRMKDGVKLAHILYKPSKEGRFPVLVTYDACLGGATVLAAEEREYLARGYAVLGVSVRGTGASEGVFNCPFGPQEGEDGKAVIEWAAKQPWCNGNVGMYGRFYAGVSQLEVAAKRPKSLKALAVDAIWGDSYDDLCYPGGVFNFGLLGQWSYLTQPYQSASGARLRQFNGDVQGARVAAANAVTNKTFEEMRGHPFPDSWWKLRNFEKRAPQIETPTLIFQGWQDPQVGARGALSVFQQLHGPKRILLSNGGGPIFANRPFLLQRLRWFDRWLKGKQNGIDKEAPVTIWFETRQEQRQRKSLQAGVFGNLRKLPAISGAPRLRTAIQPPPKPAWVSTFSTWPIPDVQWSTFYLTADGKLASAKPATQNQTGQRFYLYPAGTEIISSNETFSAAPAPLGCLVYRTGPLQDDLAILGSPVLTLYASSEQKDTDFMAVLHDVNPMGQVTYLQRGLLRASHRALDAEKSTPHEPIHLHDKAEELTPGQVYEIKFALFPVAHVLRRGHALELAIMAPPCIPSPVWAFAPLTPGVNTIYHSARYPSRLELPLAPNLKARAQEPPPGSLPLQPAREEPIKGWDNQRKNLEGILRAWKREKPLQG